MKKQKYSKTVTSLIIGEMQIKSIMRYHLPVTKLVLAKLKAKNASKDVKNIHLYFIGRRTSCYTYYRKYN